MSVPRIVQMPARSPQGCDYIKPKALELDLGHFLCLPNSGILVRTPNSMAPMTRTRKERTPKLSSLAIPGGDFA